MTRYLALLAISALTLIACGDERRFNDEPVPACVVDHGHLCGESAPGVECPPNMVCVQGNNYDTCWRRCTKGQDDSVCVPDICKGVACADNYACTYFGDYPVPPTPAEYSCYAAGAVYACPDPDGCPEDFEEREGWCIKPSDGWAGAPFN